MASATEIFRVIGKVVLEGQDVLEKGLDTIVSKADKVDGGFKKAFGGLDKNIPKNVTKPLDDSIEKTSGIMNDMPKKVEGFVSFVKDGFGLAVGTKIFDTVNGLIGKVVSTIKGASVDVNAAMESMSLDFQGLGLDADTAEEMVASLYEFAKKTPFSTQELEAADKKLVLFGGTALATTDNLKIFGDAAAASGKPLDGIATQAGKMYQALQDGAPIKKTVTALQKMGVITPEQAAKLNEMQKAGESADAIFTQFQNDLTRFNGAMTTHAGSWETVQQKITETIGTLAGKIMTPFFDMASTGLSKVNTLLQSDEFSKGAQKVAGFVADIVGNVAGKVATFVTGIWPTVVSAFNIGKDAVITFIQALSGNWSDAPGIVGLHRVIGTIGSIIHDYVIPAFVSFKDFLLNDVGPAIQSFIAAAMPTVKQFASWFVTDAIPAIVSFAKSVIETFQTQVMPAIQSFLAAIMPTLQRFGSWFISDGLPAILSFATSAINVFQNIILPAIQGVISAVMPYLQRFGSWFMTDALPQIKQFGSEIMQTWDAVEPRIVSAIQTIIAVVAPILAAIVTFVQDHGEQIKAAFTLAWNAITGILGAAIAIIKNTIELVMNLIQGDWGAAWDNIKGIFQGAWDLIVAILTPAATIIKAMITDAMSFIGQKFSDLGTLTNTVWTAISTTIQTVVNAIVAFLNPVLTAISTTWNTIWSAIQLVFDTVWRTIETIVRVEMALVQTIMEPILNAIQATWNTIWNVIQTTVQTVWDFINNNIITPIFNTISTFISTTLSTIQSTWDSVWNAVQTTVNTVWTFISSFLTDTWNNLQSSATNIWNTIQSAIEVPINAARDTLSNVWDAIHQKASDVWSSIQQIFDNSRDTIKNALLWPFEQMRDAVEDIMRAAGNKMLSPLQGAIDRFGDFVNGVKGAINWVSNKLGLNDIIRDTWGGAQIGRLAKGTRNWAGGLALIGERGIEAARLPDGSIRLFRRPQLVDLPKGSQVWNAYETRRFVTDSPNAVATLGMNGPSTYIAKLFAMQQTSLGRGGFFDTFKDKIGKLTGDALSFAQGMVKDGAQKVVNGLIDKLAIPNFPGVMSGFGSAAVKLIKNSVVEGISQLIKIIIDNAPSTTGDGTGTPGIINGVSGDKILAMAKITSGVRGYCEKFVGDVFARAGAKYARAADAFAHSQMQSTTPGTGPTGAPVFTGFNHPGDVAISMGNGMVYGTEGNGPLGAGPFSPYAGARYTLNPAANGMVIDRPTAILAGDNIPTQKEIITPERLMAQIVRNELNRKGGGFGGNPINIYVTANTQAEGYAAGKAAAKGFRDTMLMGGWNK